MVVLSLLLALLSTCAFAQSEAILQIDKSNLQFEKKHIQDQEAKLSKLKPSEETVRMLQHIQEEKIRLLEKEHFLKIREEVDLKIVKENALYLNCDASTPDISLEEKLSFPGANFQGPFHEVPRDNQGSFSTCYANTAKNLLVGATKGKAIASFLDLALQMKGEKGVVTTGLKGGESCSVIRKIKDSGYCPQAFAPLETGENNVYTQSLIGPTKSSVYQQRVVVDLLHDFLVGSNKLSKSNKNLSLKMQKHSEVIINQLKLHPNVKLPLPVVRSEIPGPWKLKALIASNKSLKAGEFLTDYKNAYRQFYPHYFRAVIEGKKRDEIFVIFREKMESFITKYNLGDNLPVWHRDFLEDTEADWTNPKLKKEIAESTAFLKAISGKENSSNEEFLKFCEENSADSFESMEFLTSLQPLVKHLKSVNADTGVMFSANGQLRSPVELMQLIVAPNCLNPDNRVKTEDEILCHEGVSTMSMIRNFGKTTEDQIRMMRERVLASLLQGYSLGNQIPGHVNTIVGMRFNRESKECELKIRESQSGTSFWKTEKSVFSEMNGLTEVRRKPSTK